MNEVVADVAFRPMNRAYNAVFKPNRLSLGLVLPLDAYTMDPVPRMTRHVERAQLAEQLGFAAVWLRDVPFNVPSFGDAGQVFDPFVYLGMLAGKTERIALGVASIILLLGIASGDRPEEYPALALPFADRGERFRDSHDYLRRMADAYPAFENAYGRSDDGMDMLPKPSAAELPLLVTGGSQQDADWIARHGDGWMLYPRPAGAQARLIADWRARVEAAGGPPKPAMEPLYIDLADDPDTSPQPLHLGMRLGMRHLCDYIRSRERIGINHVALNLRFNRADIESTLTRLAADLLPDFAA